MPLAQVTCRVPVAAPSKKSSWCSVAAPVRLVYFLIIFYVPFYYPHQVRLIFACCWMWRIVISCIGGISKGSKGSLTRWHFLAVPVVLGLLHLCSNISCITFRADLSNINLERLWPLSPGLSVPLSIPVLSYWQITRTGKVWLSVPEMLWHCCLARAMCQKAHKPLFGDTFLGLAHGH